jgi:pectinesterase
MKLFFLAPLLFLIITGTFAQQNIDMTVAQDGSGDFTTIQEAINATKSFPPRPIAIFIKNGTYNEKVQIYSWNTNLKLIGESTLKTVITWNDYFDKVNLGRNSTFHTYTLKVEANDFTAENLTVENSAGPVGQAVALHVEGDRCAFRNIRIIGNQDALYAAGRNCRQYYKHCYIEGTTDFIFGEATAFFENCTIHSKSNSYITAASTHESVEFGYVFYRCNLTAGKKANNVYLGRPWRIHAKTVFIECNLGNHINPEGWKAWSNTDDLQTTYYAVYKNSGPGSNPGKRVAWSHVLSKQEAKKYTKGNVLKARPVDDDDLWLSE